MSTILEKIRNKKILVSDGAWGTFLHQKGLKVGDCPELWNTNHAEEVYSIAKSYIDAGADLIETNSFGGNYFKLKAYGHEDKVHELNKAAAELSKKAAGENVLVIGSIGPTGKMVFMGDITEEELYDAFKNQAIALVEGGADAIIVETMTDIDEARIAVKAASENTGKEVICTFTFDKLQSGEFKTMMGVSPTEMTELLINAGATVIGANCGNGIADMISIVKEIRNVNSEIPILIHANAGLPKFIDGKTIFPESPEEMASMITQIIDAGANIIGGCCGTTPAHIVEIKKIIDSHTEKPGTSIK